MKKIAALLVSIVIIAALFVACGNRDPRDEVKAYKIFLDRLAPEEAHALNGLKLAAQQTEADSFISTISSKVAPDLEAIKIKLGSRKVEDERLAEIHAFHLQALDSYLQACRSSIEGIIQEDRAILARAGQASALGDRLLKTSKSQLNELLVELEIE
jgi:hypothetical protein